MTTKLETTPISKLSPQDYKSIHDSLERAQIVIEFDLNGKILTANQNFLFAFGYNLEEVIGQHHRLLCDSAFALTKEYRNFWDQLSKGIYISGEYNRMAKTGQEIWIQASYNPIFNEKGMPYKIIKFATDINEQKLRNAENSSSIQAIHRSQAVAEFTLEGFLLNANENFLRIIGYELNEIINKHHSFFCSKSWTQTESYKFFWDRLARGQFESNEYHRLGKSEKNIWIQASYNPIFDAKGRPVKIIKFATDITNAKLRTAEFIEKVNAIGRSQAVIEFDLEGKITSANETFLKLIGYQFSEIQNQSHSLFCESSYANSIEYQNFWSQLRNGVFQSGAYKRIGRGGQEVWIHATYNPILDFNGKPYKVVKFATDITHEKLKSSDFESQIQAIQKTQAAIEFDLKGTILSANQNFLTTMGYEASEIIGQHHRIFCESSYTTSIEYRNFWEKLALGHFDLGEYCRKDKNGNDVWIVASYNPIFDLNGRPYKVIKYATDITKEKNKAQFISNTAKKITSSVIELSSSAKSIASSAHQASHLAEVAEKQAQSGQELVGRVMNSSNKIQESSKKISDIVKVIRDLADRTNLIAFNAAIEAARAGENGRGFSVVADEVRKLAERSADATKEIENLINQTFLLVESGTQLSTECGKSFESIISGAHETSTAIKKIAESTEEQLNLSQDIQLSVQAITEQSEESNKTKRLQLAKAS